MITRARIFVDYWNFQLNWNERSNEARCDWLALPNALLDAAEELTGREDVALDGLHIYASVDPANETLVNWLETVLDRQPGFLVSTARMLRRQRPVRCSACGAEEESCPRCGEAYTVALTKGLTTRMVCDVLGFALGGASDISILVTSDSELAPALRTLRDRGHLAIHAGWKESGLELVREAWATIELDQLAGGLVRS